ncbi:MAG: class I SAM-dependent methyltransferase [Nitrospirales bacterium]|nr:class I SAM-dependent methyltransferase [Nitrospira sp.]MDR4488859.1 class I SAM-dependent methyltransferase [Nitrospirales bacterium]
MRQAAFGPLRESVLAQASGEVLEIGFGTGANLPFYASHIRWVAAIDPNPGMVSLARPQISQQPRLAGRIHWIMASGEALPFLTDSFDSVVSTMTLCSVPNISSAIQEIHRVLKPGGKFVFLEHGQSPDDSVRRWQEWLTPYWKHLGDGCHLNRPMARLIHAQSWTLLSLTNFYLPGVPKPFAYFYQGCAVKTGKGQNRD